jgi:hypothetical protein
MLSRTVPISLKEMRSHKLLISFLFLQSGIYAQDARTNGITDIEFGTREEPISAFYPEEAFTTAASDDFLNLILPTASVTSTHCHNIDDVKAHHTTADANLFDAEATDADIAVQVGESFESAFAEEADDYVDAEANIEAIAEQDYESFESAIAEGGDDYVQAEITEAAMVEAIAEQDYQSFESAIAEEGDDYAEAEITEAAIAEQVTDSFESAFAEEGDIYAEATTYVAIGEEKFDSLDAENDVFVVNFVFNHIGDCNRRCCIL